MRTAQIAGVAAQGIADAITASALQVWVRIQGRPQMKLGDLARLERFPSRAGVDQLDGTYQVRGVTHRLTKADGLLTDLTLRSLVGAAAAAAAPGGGAP